MDEKILNAVKDAAIDGSLSCAEAEALAEKLGCQRSEVGNAANEAKIKIVGCQLGCF
jgi:hypothetical protein